jgi:hypothetical protein
MLEAITGVPAAKASVRHHAEALAGERGRAEHVRLVQGGPERVAGDAPAGIDRVHQLGVGEVAGDVLALGADHGQPRRHVLDQGAEGGQQDGQPLALLGRPTNRIRSSSEGGFGPLGAAPSSTRWG